MILLIRISCLALCVVLGVSVGWGGEVMAAPAGLRCKYFVDPIGVDTAAPRFFWRMESEERGARQVAYQVLVAGSEEALAQNRGNAWDSGRVESDRTTHVAYEGAALESARMYWWKVRLWNEKGEVTAYSAPAKFQMGMLRQDDWQGEWIASGLELLDHQKLLRAMPDFNMEPTGEIWKMAGPAREVVSKVTTAPAVYLRHEFETTAPLRRATAFVCGLGLHELSINGAAASDHKLSPAFTDYDKRVLYETLDVTKLVKPGRNAIGVTLGNGWFNLITPHVLRYHTADYIAPPRLRMNLVLEYDDGSSRTVVTSPEWKCTTEGPIQFNCVLAGETYDAGREMPGWDTPGYDTQRGVWSACRVTSGPAGMLQSQMLPPVRVITTGTAVRVKRRGEGWRFDLGEESTGWSRLKLRGKPGQRITIAYPGSGSHTLGRYQTCIYYCKGEGDEFYAPRFCYGGYRFVDVTGLDYEPQPSDLVAEVVNSDLESVGDFQCSDNRFNKLQEILRRTFRNYVVHIPADPTREKAGWTEDVHGDFFEHNWNQLAAPTYLNWQREFVNAVQANGYVPPVVPSRFDGPDINGPWWGGAVIYTPWLIYRVYGDTRVLEESFPAMEKYFGYLKSIEKDGIVEWGLGDWLEVGSVRPVRTPVAQTSTAAYGWFAQILRDSARLLGKEAGREKYGKEWERIREAYNRKFLNPETGQYAQGSQTSQLVSLELGLVPSEMQDRVKARLAEKVKSDNYHLTSGFVGVPMLLTGLTEWGLPDEAWTIATQEDDPSFIGATIGKGNSVMKEDWHGGQVQMPTLQGPIGSWFYECLAGFRRDTMGMQHMRLKPETSNTLTWVRAHYESLHGRYESEWHKDGKNFTWKVRVPANTSATLYIPAKALSAVTVDGGKPVEQAPGLGGARMAGARLEVNAESGLYEFVSREAPEQGK